MASFHIGQEQHIQDLQYMIHSRRRCLLIAGYGLSALASTTGGLYAPHSWQELLREVAERARQAGYISYRDFSAFQKLLTHQAWNRAGAKLESCLSGTTLLHYFLRELLLGRFQSKSEVHRLIVSIPFQAYVVTTLDLFIEDVYLKAKREKLMKFYDVQQALDFKIHETPPFILKLNGDIAHESSPHIADLDFQQRLSSKDTGLVDNWQRLMVDVSMLLLGFEPESPDMECLEHFCKRKLFTSQIPHWIAIPQSQEGTFKKRLTEKYRYFQIISYPEPTEKGLIDFLELLLPESRRRSPSNKRKIAESTANVLSQMTSEPCPIAILWEGEDKFLWKKLEQQLKLLQNESLITIWHTGKIPPGDDPIETMVRQIESAKIILLLTSTNFLSNQTLMSLTPMIALFHRGRTKKVLNIILSSYDRQAANIINNLPILPEEGKALDLLQGGHQQYAFSSITEKVRQMVNELGNASNF